jgi:hypothetical protein
MPSATFFIVAVALGAVVLLAVVWAYVRGETNGVTALSITLSVLGFALVGSRLWASIVVKTDTVELSLLRECQQQAVQSADETANLLEVVKDQAPPPKAAQLQPIVEQARQSVEQLRVPEASQPPEEHVRRLREAVGTLSDAVRTATRTLKNQ